MSLVLSKSIYATFYEILNGYLCHKMHWNPIYEGKKESMWKPIGAELTEF
jgi:hypothetical protein